jgi:hypothetical protein
MGVKSETLNAIQTEDLKVLLDGFRLLSSLNKKSEILQQ